VYEYHSSFMTEKSCDECLFPAVFMVPSSFSSASLREDFVAEL
jgi:hypothetical protein